jgi:hypothetical protein
MIKSNDSKFHKKHSTIKKQTQSITPRILSKAKIDQKLLKEKKSEIKNSVKNRQTISPKENIKKKSSQTFVKPFNKVSTNILGTSNGALPTNYTDKEEEKKNRQTVICNNNINFKDEMKLRYLGNLFRTSNLKKTIIIDSDGNNNLNLNKNIFIEKSNENQNKDLNKKENLKKSKSTHKQIISDNIIMKNDINEHKKIPNNKQLKNENDIRLIEYDFIFDLLNTNIEEMKDMFKNKSVKPKESSDNIFKKTPKKKIIQIFSEKDKEEINNIKPLLSQIEISQNNNDNNSFLESCIQDDFYQSIVNKPQTNSYHSFEMSSVINNNVNTSSNLNTINSNRTECELEDNTQIEDKVLKISEINPHFLVEKKYKKKSLENIGKNQNSKSTKNLSGITNKCSIF